MNEKDRERETHARRIKKEKHTKIDAKGDKRGTVFSHAMKSMEN
jgi:hypothetical protein